MFRNCGSIAIDSLMRLLTNYTTWLPLPACHCLAALLAKMSALNSLVQQNACYRNIKWTFAGLLPRYCYAIKTNSRTILSRLSQPASAGKGRDMGELQAHHCMTL